MKFTQDFDAKILSNTKVLITLVGLSPLPLAMNIDVLQPKKVYFLYSDLSINEIYVIKGLIKHSEFKEFKIRINENKVEDLYEKILHISETEDAKNIVIDITGGKKLMVAGAVSAANSCNINYIYTDFKDYDKKTRLPKPNSEYLHFIKNIGNFHATLTNKSDLDSDFLDLYIIFQENNNYLNFILNDPNIILKKAVNKALLFQLSRGFNGINQLKSGKMLNELKSFADFLVKYFIPRDVLKVLNNSKKSKVRLNLNEEILDIPWELLNFSKALKKKKTFYRKALSGKLHLSLNETSKRNIKKISILVNLDGTLEGAQKEGEALKEFFNGIPGIDVSFFSGINNSMSVFKLFEILEESDIVHYAGHGFRKEGNQLKTGWKLNDDFVQGELFSDIEKPPCFIFSNSCFGGKGKTHSNKNSTCRNDLLVSGLLDAGVNCFIISPIGVPDHNNPEEIIKFYSKLLIDRIPVTQAYRETIGSSKDSYLYQFYGDLDNIKREKI